nr:glycoside hydrolase family 43 protein [Fodinibius salsisoli]
MFSYFVGNGEDGLHLAHSTDGLKWKPLNAGESLLTPRVGEDKLMRDPSIVQGPDGTFHMVWTVSWGEQGIGYASSEDLIHWSEQQFIPVMEHEPDALNCWAPELFYDEQSDQFVIVWATTIPGKFPKTDGQDGDKYNHRLYAVTTKDFSTFSDTELFYDHGFNVIDGAIFKAGDQYAMLLKDETNEPFPVQKNIRLAFSDHATGPWTDATNPITGDYWAEGPTVLKIDGKWHVYFDKYIEGQYGLIVSDDLKEWQDLSSELQMPEEMRHGTTFKVSTEVANKLLNQLN